MSTIYRYALPVELTEWKFEGRTETRFTWEYEDERRSLLALYDKGKKQQWDAALAHRLVARARSREPDAARRPHRSRSAARRCGTA